MQLGCQILVHVAESEEKENERNLKCKLARRIRDLALKYFICRVFRLCAIGSAARARGRWSGSGRIFAKSSGQSAARFEFRHERRCFDQYSGVRENVPYSKLVGSRPRVLSVNRLRLVILQIAGSTPSYLEWLSNLR